MDVFSGRKKIGKFNMTKLNVGIIGVGGAGRAHSTRFRESEHVGNLYGFDVKEIEFPLLEMKYQFDEFLGLVDAVSICTPDDSHYEYIEKALSAGKHVLVEKPMVASAYEARKVADMVSKYDDLVFAVHHQMRYVPAFQEAKKIIESGELGEIFYIEANYWHNMRERDLMFDDWRVKGKGQSIIFGGACHPLDLILYLVGECVESHKTLVNKKAYRRYPLKYTSATSILRFESGLVAKCHTNNCVVFPQYNNLVVLGDKGSYIDGVIWGSDGVELRRFETINEGRLLGKLWSKVASMLVRFSAKVPSFRANPFSVYDHNYACKVIVDNFISSIQGREKALVSYMDGERVIALCEEMEGSALENEEGRLFNVSAD